MTDSIDTVIRAEKPNNKHHWKRCAEIVQAGIPLLLGTICLIQMANSIDTGIFPDARVIPIFKTAFILSTLAYAMAFASLVVVFTGTLLYIFDLNKIAREVGKNGSAVFYAMNVLSVMLLIIIGLVVWLIFSVGQPEQGDFCSARDLTRNFIFHDSIVMVIFIGFVIVDCLTIQGLGAAAKAIPIHERDQPHAREIASSRAWAKGQLLLIDVPVIAGAFILLLMVHGIEGKELMMHFDRDVIAMPHSTSSVHVAREAMTRLECYEKPLADVQGFIGNTFIAGVATGALAAHVLMSQFIFMILSIFFREPATGTANTLAGIIRGAVGKEMGEEKDPKTP